jgi:hypothetical protein
MRAALLVWGIAACDKAPETSAYEPANLERATVTLDGIEEIEGIRRDWIGNLQVDGDGQRFTLAVTTESAGTQEVEVHSSAHSDLAALDGIEGVQLSVAPEPLSQELSLSLTDSAGELLYLVEPVEAGLLTTEKFGLGLIAEGSDLGVASVEAHDLSLTSALFRTDAGDVELMPGEPQEVAIDGAAYRVVLITSFDSDYRLEGAANCTGADSRLAFELLRIEAGTADLTAIVRPEGVELPVEECIAD